MFQDLVKDLYSYRDRFFETHTIEKAVEKRDLVEHKMKEVLDELDNLTRKHHNVLPENFSRDAILICLIDFLVMMPLHLYT